MTITKLITDFLEYMEVEKGRSILTVRNYDHYLQEFAGFAKLNKIETPDKIDLELVRQYRLYLNRIDERSELVSSKWVASATERSVSDTSVKRTSLSDKRAKPLSHATQNYYLIALRSFFKYLAKRDIKTLAPEKVELSKTDERQIVFLDDDELETLFTKPDLKTLQGRRDRAILDLLFSTGLRVSELCNLKKTDINLERGEFSVKGKGGKVRVVFVDHEAKESLKRYLAMRYDKSEFLFISYGHSNSADSRQLAVDEPMTPRSVQRMIHKYALEAGITKHVTPHTIRHSFATDLLMSGADLRAVQSLLGHSSITTTQIYTHVTDQHLQDVHEAFHGLRRGENTTDETDNNIPS